MRLNEQAIPSENRLSRWHRRYQEAAAMDRKVAEIVRDCSVEVPSRTELSRATAAGDPWKLRGIPAVGGRGSVGGAIPGTRP